MRSPVAWIVALAGAVAVLAPGAAAETHHRRHHATHHHPTHHHATHHHASHHHTSHHAAAGISRIPNMPPGWTWPPSRTMKKIGSSCLAKLDAMGVKWKRARAVRKVSTPITIPSMELGGLELRSIWRKGPFVMDCQLALALATYGPQLHDLGVRKLRFSRIYGYTPVRVDGKTKPFLSRHALGLAMDVYEFVDDQDRKHVVERDYLAGDPLLHQIEQTINDSGGFRLCLTPRNDPLSHHDHFHLEASVVYPPGTRPHQHARHRGHRRVHTAKR